MVAAQMNLDEDLTDLLMCFSSEKKVVYSPGSAITGSTSHTKVKFRKILGVGEIPTIKAR